MQPPERYSKELLEGLAIIAIIAVTYVLVFKVVDMTDIWKYIYVPTGVCREMCARVWMSVIVQAGSYFIIMIGIIAIKCIWDASRSGGTNVY